MHLASMPSSSQPERLWNSCLGSKTKPTKESSPLRRLMPAFDTPWTLPITFRTSRPSLTRKSSNQVKKPPSSTHSSPQTHSLVRDGREVLNVIGKVHGVSKAGIKRLNGELSFVGFVFEPKQEFHNLSGWELDGIDARCI